MNGINIETDLHDAWQQKFGILNNFNFNHRVDNVGTGELVIPSVFQ